MTEPSDAAKRKACELANAQGCRWAPDEPTPQLYALALYIDEVDRVVRAVAELPPTDTWRDTILRALMPPDTPDPDEELAREVADWLRKQPGLISWQSDVPSLIIKRLREQGRLTDAE